MKLSRAFSDRKTKTDIYSKYAARNRCKFVPTLCLLMSPHKKRQLYCQISTKCEIAKQILDMLRLEAYHMSSFDSQTSTYDASLSSKLPFLGFLAIIILLIVEILQINSCHYCKRPAEDSGQSE